MHDGTLYRFDDLRLVMTNEAERDDLLAVAMAARKAEHGRLAPWVAMSGPLPAARADRDGHVDVVGRGMGEMRTYLNSLGLLR